MPIDPSFLPPAASPEERAARRERMPVITLEGPPVSEATPNLLHTVLFALLVVVAGVLVAIGFGVAARALAVRMHESLDQMQTDPRIVLPMEGLIYVVGVAGALLVLPRLWHRRFASGVHWRGGAVRRSLWLLVGIGVVTSVLVQLLSNFLPIPKELPIDKFFTNPLGVWLVAIFGVTIAPAFEELAFRGFLLPSLASAWDWLAEGRLRRTLAGKRERATPEDWQAEAAVYASLPSEGDIVFHRTGMHATEDDDDRGDPRWSTPAIVFATVITSMAFAWIHGKQLAHSLPPLAVLFLVSLVLCITRLRFRSLAASTLVHSMYNATIFVMLFIGTGGFRHLDKLTQ